MLIGVEQDTGFIYEGRSNYGHPLWPAPTLSPAAVGSAFDGELSAVETNDLLRLPMLFREDSFDPVSRIRRGRLYERVEGQPAQWYVHPHPAVPAELQQGNLGGGQIPKYLATFRSFRFQTAFSGVADAQPLILLGTAGRFTVWTLIMVESLHTGEELLVLKARQSLGALPTLWEERVPADEKAKVVQALGKLADEVYRAAPESVVDRARDALSVVLTASLRDRGATASGKDLGALVKTLANLQPGQEVVVSAARIVARLHARGKPVEQERRHLRPVLEQDAELAVGCVGVVLCDLGWARWR